MTPITGAAAWRGDELSQSDEWVYLLNADQIAELEDAGRRFVLDDPDLRLVQAADYPIPSLHDAIAEWGADCDFGRGFVLVRGLRPHLYSDALSAAIYYILSLHLGEPMPMSYDQDLFDHVYATPTPQLLEQRELVRAELAADREDGR